MSEAETRAKDIDPAPKLAGFVAVEGGKTLSEYSIKPGHGANIVISHQVKPDQHDAYERWLGEIVAVCQASPGHPGVKIIRPSADATATHTVTIQFDTIDHFLAWTGSPDRTRLIETVRPFLVGHEKFFVLSGLDFWFTPKGAQAKLPSRWKQSLVTWSAIYPLVLGIPLVLDPVLRQLAMLENHYIKTMFVTGVVVLLMVYVIMPRYTALVHRWLFH